MDEPEAAKAGAPWAFIAVMGVTGAGKSTFVRTVSGDNSVVVGDGLKSCTSELQGHSFHYRGYNINLVDSPGFNDTFRSETEVLQDVSRWLRETYEENNKLSGIIYLHGINLPKMTGSALRNLKVFRELCGPDPLKNVVLVTTFWDNVDQAVGKRREDELANESEFWGSMLERGSRMSRFTDRASGLAIMTSLIDREPETLKIQHEMVKEEKLLINTAAGQVVSEELVRLEKQHALEKKKMQEEMAEALKQRDVEMQEILETQSKKLEEEVNRVHRQQEQLRADRRAETRRLVNDFESAMFELRSRNEELEQDVDDLRGDARRRQRERASHDQRLRQLERYNMEAWKRWEGLDIEAVIAKMRAEESKLVTEDREKLEAGIARLRDDIRKGKKRGLALNMFFSVLRAAISVVSKLTLGMPITLPSPSGDSNDANCGSDFGRDVQPMVNENKNGSQSATDNATAQNSGLTISNHILRRRKSQASSTDGLLAGQEPMFIGVVLNPKGSLKVVNVD